MKTLTLFPVTVILAFCFIELSLFAQSEVVTYAQSPDHPRTWVVGADNIHQAIRWDISKRRLFADIKYSTREYADGMHPAKEEDYSLVFSSVQLDPEKEKLTSNGLFIGTLRHGFFGSAVVLNHGLELDVRRKHGRIYAAIAQVDGE